MGVRPTCLGSMAVAFFSRSPARGAVPPAREAWLLLSFRVLRADGPTCLGSKALPDPPGWF